MKKIQSILNRFILNEHMHNTVRLQFDYMHAYIFIHNSKFAKYIESNVSVYIKKNVLVTYLKWMNKFMKNHRNGVMPAIPYTYFHSILDIFDLRTTHVL